MKTNAQGLKRGLGVALFLLSFALYGLLLLVPLAPLSAESKIAFSALVVVLAESSFWLSVLILGREAMAKYRKFEEMIEGYLARLKECKEYDIKGVILFGSVA